MGVHATAVYSQVLLCQNLLVTVQILESWDQVLSELIEYINEYLLLLIN